MPEETLFESESYQSRAEVAAYLRSVAEKLEAGGTITLRAGDDSISVDVPANVEFEVEVEREGPSGAPGELSVEFELEWDEDAAETDGSLSIE